MSPSNHKYDTQDYEHVDPHYGVIVQEAEGLADTATRETAVKASTPRQTISNPTCTPSI